MHVAKRYALIVAALGTLVGPASAQTPLATSPDRHLFTWEDAVLGASFVVGTFAIRPLDKTAARALQRPDRQMCRLYRRTASFVPTAAQPGSTIIGLSMYGAGRLTGNDRLAAVGLHGTEALFLGAAAGTV